MLRRFKSWRFALSVSAALWAITWVILWFTYDSDRPNGVRPGLAPYVVNRIGTLTVIAAWITLVIAIYAVAAACWRHFRRQHQSPAA